MARADRRRVERAKPAPEPARYDSAYVGTEGLFFQRIRRQAKWMFVVLALIFAVGFVAFGVGSDVQGGLADVLGSGNSSSGLPSVSDAEEKLIEKPSDPTALRELATALQTENRVEEAAGPLERYLVLRPRDAGALRELASVHLTRATRLRNEAQLAQYEAQIANPRSAVLAPATTPFGQELAKAPVVDAATESANGRVNALFTELTSAYGEAKAAYQRLAGVTPRDASVQLQLADAAQNSGDTATAVGAYRRFLTLAPDDSSAPLVRQELKRLQTPTSPGGQVGG